MSQRTLTPELAAAVVAALPVPAWVVDAAGEVLAESRRATALAGAEGLLPTPLEGLVGDDEGVSCEIGMREGGREVFFRPTAGRLAGGGVLITLEDVTRTRWLDEAETDLVGVISHEVKTPLTGIRMALHLLAEKKIGLMNERQTGVVATARAECERLLVILNELLGLGKKRGS